MRPFKKGDAFSLQRSLNSRKLWEHMGSNRYPFTLGYARKAVKRSMESHRKKKRLNMAIVINGEAVGHIWLHFFDGDQESHKAELGYMLGEDYWNRGIVTEAIKLMSGYAFKRLKLKRIQANCYKLNPASRRVLEKNGFKFEGIARKDAFKKGRYFDTVNYAKIR